MNKLTAEKCRSVIQGLKWMAAEGPGMSIRDEYDIQAYEHALKALEQQERVCQKCGGTGLADSGAHTAGGRKVMVKCDCQFGQQEQGDWIEWWGGKCPVSPKTIVVVRYRKGKEESPGEAGGYFWNNTGSSVDIIAYRIIPEQPTNQNGEQ